MNLNKTENRGKKRKKKKKKRELLGTRGKNTLYTTQNCTKV
jgi:hypothetical protein